MNTNVKRILEAVEKGDMTSDEALLDVENSDSLIYSSVESICRYYAEQYQISVRIIYSPHLISGHYKDDFWCRIFDALEKGTMVDIKARKRFNSIIYLCCP